MTQQTFSAKEVASQLGINPKRFRAFVRTLARSDAAIIAACGQGNRYGITKGDAAKLIAAYRKAHPNHVMPKAHAPKAPRKAKAPVEQDAPVVPAIMQALRTQGDAEGDA